MPTKSKSKKMSTGSVVCPKCGEHYNVDASPHGAGGVGGGTYPPPVIQPALKELAKGFTGRTPGAGSKLVTPLLPTIERIRKGFGRAR